MVYSKCCFVLRMVESQRLLDKFHLKKERFFYDTKSVDLNFTNTPIVSTFVDLILKSIFFYFLCYIFCKNFVLIEADICMQGFCNQIVKQVTIWFLPKKHLIFFIFFNCYIAFQAFVTPTMPLLRSSLTPIGSIRYPDSCVVQNTLDFFHNFDESASGLQSPLKITFLAVLDFPHASSKIIFDYKLFYQEP